MITGIIVIAIIIGIALFLIVRKKKPLSYEQYCNGCIEQAKIEMKVSKDALKTILVLTKINDIEVAPFIFIRHEDGKVTKKRIHFKSFPFDKCPSDIQNSISKGECIIHKF